MKSFTKALQNLPLRTHLEGSQFQFQLPATPRPAPLRPGLILQGALHKALWYLTLTIMRVGFAMLAMKRRLQNRLQLLPAWVGLVGCWARWAWLRLRIVAYLFFCCNAAICFYAQPFEFSIRYATKKI